MPGKDGRWDVLHPGSLYNPYALTFPPSTEAPLPFETPPATAGIIRATSPSPTRQEVAQMAALIAAQEDGVDYTKIPGYGMVVKGVPAIHEIEEPPSAPDSIIVEDTSNKRLIEIIGLFEEGEGNLQAGGSIHTISTGNGSESSTLIITDEDDEDLEQMIQVNLRRIVFYSSFICSILLGSPTPSTYRRIESSSCCRRWENTSSIHILSSGFQAKYTRLCRAFAIAPTAGQYS